MEYMVPPIRLCTNGHNICSKCREGVQICPTCRAEFTGIRSLALENIARRQKYPCANRQSGCLELFSIEHIAEHHVVCVYGKNKCPFQMTGKCSWKGLKSDLKEHTKAAHPKQFFESPTHRSPNISDGLVMLSCFGNLFTIYKLIMDGRLYGAVHLIGTSSEASKYKCEFTLRAENGIEQISYTFLVRSSTEHCGRSFESGKCLNLDEERVRNFFVKNEFNLTITLSTV
jgi:hypothetical protein